MKAITSLVLTIGWIYGIVLAHGFWSTFFAVFIPLWSWYLAVEHIAKLWGIL